MILHFDIRKETNMKRSVTEKSLLRQMFDGEFYPCENVVSEDPAYRTRSKEMYELKEYIKQMLPPEDVKQMDKLQDLQQQTQEMEYFAFFAEGYRCGVLLMIELILGK